MSSFALLCVVVGLLMIATRGPLLVAPEKTRDFYFGLIGSEQKIRLWGVFMTVFGAVAVWIAGGAPGVVAQVIWFIGLFIIAVGALFVVPFPAKALALTDKIWNAFSPNAMRAMGLVAVVIGAALAYYGFAL